MLKVKFWGVRGSIPCPGYKTAKYGGNGACLEIRTDSSKNIYVIDAGTGIRELGNFLMDNDLPGGPLDIKLFLSHTHWDHIMGFPYFAPIYTPGTRLKIYGPTTFDDGPLQDVAGGRIKYGYLPVYIGDLAADIEYTRLKEDTFIDMGSSIRLSTMILNHPVTTLGYRFEYNGKVLCTCYDTEPFRNPAVFTPEDPEYDEAAAREGGMVADKQNKAVERFFKGADLLIHDSQYTEEEYLANRVGWGHTSIEHAIGAAVRAGVKKLALFHHDPDRTDDQIDELAKVYCEPGKYGDTEVFFAREGEEIDLFEE